jgi:pimeloyl-ACP methyl ester carboxylesterase
VIKAAIVSGVAPPEMPGRFKGMWPPVRLIFFTARYFPGLNRMLLKQMGGFYADKEMMLKRMKQALPPPDVALIDARPEVIDIFSAAAKEAHRYGLDGDAWEWHLYVHPWEFALADVRARIGLWYGQYDQNVPVGMGQYLAGQFPNSQLTVVNDGGHFSTVNNHIGTIFNYLTESK